MKKIARRFALVAVAIVVVLAAGTFMPRPLWRPGSVDDAATYRIYLLSNPIHTDIAIPLDANVLARFAGLMKTGIQADLPAARYLIFGWGGRAFYIGTPTWGDLRPIPLFKGLTLDHSVMHVDLSASLQEPQPWLTGFDVSAGEFERLLDFIQSSFQSGPEGPIRIVDASYGQYDGFYEANGYFNALGGCNTWTAAALREAGLRTGWWNPLPQSLALSVRLYN